MRVTYYILRNNSLSNGEYLLGDEYKTIYPGEVISLLQKPTNYTSNVTLSITRSEVADKPKKSQKVSVDEGE